MKTCKYCGKLFDKSNLKDLCSHFCYEKWRQFNNTPNCNCTICKKEMYLKPYRINRTKNGVVCSEECEKQLRSNMFKGINNHQFGLKGYLNSSFKGEEIFKKNNNLIDIWVYRPFHPFRNKINRVKKHIIVVEENAHLFDRKYFIDIDNKLYLSKKYHIHHIDENHNNNEISNLQILTPKEHTKLHNKNKIIKRDKLGRIIGVIKQEELLGSPEVGNQQPSLGSNTFEGSTTNSRVQTSKVEDSNANTSILHF